MRSLTPFAAVLILLTLAPPNAFVSAQTRSNGKIAFSQTMPSNDSQIYVINEDGTGLTQIPGPCCGAQTYLNWSPDGTKLVFASVIPDGNYEIYKINADGTGVKNLTNNPGQDLRPSWSPDGSNIAFASLRNTVQSIYVMNADGTGQTRLSFVDADSAPSWSADGAKIVFTSISLTTRNEDLYVINADGSNLVRVTSGPLHDSFPAWQPKLAPTFSPTLITEPGTADALALDSMTHTRGPFFTLNPHNLGADQGTRVALFAVYAELLPGEGASAVTAQAEDAQHTIYPLTVEHVGQVPGMAWLTQFNVRLPGGLAGAGEVLVSISLRGATSNKALIKVN